jgi:hypothetical protein
VFPWRRKESKKKTPTEYFTGIFVLKKTFKKRSHKEEKKERKNAKKVTKSDQMHSFPSRASLSLSLSLPLHSYATTATTKRELWSRPTKP